jgi:hypothetical protein
METNEPIELFGLLDRVAADRREMAELKERIHRVINWHKRQSAPGGMVGDFCTECGEHWPCDTRLMLEGKYVDEE